MIGFDQGKFSVLDMKMVTGHSGILKMGQEGLYHSVIYFFSKGEKYLLPMCTRHSTQKI